MHALDQGPTQRPYLPQPVDDNDLISEGRRRMMMVTDQSSKQNPSILPLAALGGETFAGGAFPFPSNILILQSTLMESGYIMPIYD